MSEKSIMVRLPTKLVNLIKEYQKNEQLPTFGYALEYYIRQALDERIEGKLSSLEQKIAELEDTLRLLFPHLLAPLYEFVLTTHNVKEIHPNSNVGMNLKVIDSQFRASKDNCHYAKGFRDILKTLKVPGGGENLKTFFDEERRKELKKAKRKVTPSTEEHVK